MEKKKDENENFYLDVWSQMVVPSLSALLPNSSIQKLSYVRPFAQPVLVY